MKNNIKIDFTSRAFALYGYLILVSIGTIAVGFVSWYLYNGITATSMNIDNILNLQDKVTIEVVDMKKLNSIKDQLERHDLTDPDKDYANPFIAK
jgi:hypothetical protein